MNRRKNFDSKLSPMEEKIASINFEAFIHHVENIKSHNEDIREAFMVYRNLLNMKRLITPTKDDSKLDNDIQFMRTDHKIPILNFNKQIHKKCEIHSFNHLYKVLQSAQDHAPYFSLPDDQNSQKLSNLYFILHKQPYVCENLHAQFKRYLSAQHSKCSLKIAHFTNFINSAKFQKLDELTKEILSELNKTVDLSPQGYDIQSLSISLEPSVDIKHLENAAIQPNQALISIGEISRQAITDRNNWKNLLDRYLTYVDNDSELLTYDPPSLQLWGDQVKAYFLNLPP